VFANPQPACFVVVVTIIQVNVVATFYLLKHMWCFTAEKSGCLGTEVLLKPFLEVFYLEK